MRKQKPLEGDESYLSKKIDLGAASSLRDNRLWRKQMLLVHYKMDG